MNAETLRYTLNREFSSLEFARDEFPMLTTWGVKDESICVHSLGCNYLSALGRQLGFWAINEYPVRVSSRYIRPDIVWWTRPDGSPLLLGEFERFEPGQTSKLVDKARNLMQTYEALERKPEALLLMAWTIAGTDISANSVVRSVAFDGFRTPEGQLIEGLGTEATFVLAHAIFGQSNGQLRLLEVQS